MQRSKAKISTAQAWLLLIISLVLGTVFTFGMRYWNAPIELEDGVSVKASFLKYDIRYGRGHNINEIKLSFSDRDALYIDGSCVNDTVLRSLQALSSGDELRLIVHPSTDTILQMMSNDMTILRFQETRDSLLRERNGFGVLGILMYVVSACALIVLLKIKVKSK